jgi:hypothetical protein
MAQDGIDDSLNDDRLAREIDALMDVHPSPEFIARIRTRVDSEPVRSTWFGARSLACASMAACLVTVIVTWANWPEQRQAPRAPLMAETPAAASVRIEPQSTPPEIVMPLARSVSDRVLVSPADAAGLRYFVSALRDGRLDSDLLPPVIADATPITIEPIIIEPLVAAADLDAGGAQ